MPAIRERDDQTGFLSESGARNEYWWQRQLGGPHHLDVLVHHEIAFKTADHGHEAGAGCSSAHERLSRLPKLLQLLYDLLGWLLGLDVEVCAAPPEVVRDEAGGAEGIPLLVADLASMLAQNEERLLAEDEDVHILQVDIKMQIYLPRLLAQIGYPRRLNVCFFTIGSLLLLYLLLLLQIVIRKCLHGVEIVALHLKIAVGNDEAVRRLRVDHGTGHKEVWQLDFEQDVVVIEEVKRAIYRLHAYLVIFVALGAELTTHEIEGVALQFVDLALSNLRKLIVGLDDVY